MKIQEQTPEIAALKHTFQKPIPYKMAYLILDMQNSKNFEEDEKLEYL